MIANLRSRGRSSSGGMLALAFRYVPIGIQFAYLEKRLSKNHLRLQRCTPKRFGVPVSKARKGQETAYQRVTRRKPARSSFSGINGVLNTRRRRAPAIYLAFIGRLKKASSTRPPAKSPRKSKRLLMNLTFSGRFLRMG